MENPIIEHESQAHHPMGFITGLLLGGLAGAVTMLLVAPQSGANTRANIQKKGIELRDQTVETVQEAVTQAQTKARQITTGVRDKVEELKQRGQEVLTEPKEHLPTTVEPGYESVKDILH
jgi:gas vesicle protein